MAIDAAIAAVSVLLTKVFGFIVDPDGLATMKLEHRLSIIRSGITIALDKGDFDAADRLFQECRDISRAKSY